MPAAKRRSPAIARKGMTPFRCAAPTRPSRFQDPSAAIALPKRSLQRRAGGCRAPISLPMRSGWRAKAIPSRKLNCARTLSNSMLFKQAPQFRAEFSHRRQNSRRRDSAQKSEARRYARTSRPRRLCRFLSRRYRPGDRGRYGTARHSRRRVSDLQSYAAILREPLSLRLPGRTHYNTPPPTQGIVGLIMLGLFDRLGPVRPESFEHIHGLVEAAKRSLALRDRICTDFAHLPRDPYDFLKPEFLAREAAMIDMRRAAALPVAAAEGDTVWMGAIDAQGRAVSFIQSIYWEYGSGLRAACDRHSHAQLRLLLFARSARVEPPAAGGASFPHADSADRRLRRWTRHALWIDGRRRPAAVSIAGLSAQPLRSSARRSRRSPAFSFRQIMGRGGRRH